MRTRVSVVYRGKALLRPSCICHSGTFTEHANIIACPQQHVGSCLITTMTERPLLICTYRDMSLRLSLHPPSHHCRDQGDSAVSRGGGRAPGPVPPARLKQPQSSPIWAISSLGQVMRERRSAVAPSSCEPILLVSSSRTHIRV